MSALRLGTAFALGVACALWLFPVIAGPRMQELRLARDKAEQEAESLREEVAKLKQAAQNQQWQPRVSRARVEVEAPDQRVAVEAKRRLHKELTQLVGRPLDDISFLLLYTRLQGALMVIDGVKYRLEVKAIVIAPELRLYGGLSPVKSQSGE